MARYDLETLVTVSVLDRLIDREPKKATEPPPTRARSMRQLKDGLQRDLEWLLNTRRSIEDLGGVYKEIERSVFTYGLPDISSIGVHSTHDQAKLKRALERAVSLFEPRIKGARVVMEVFGRGSRAIRFHIQGMLDVDPAPEPVAFDTVLELPSYQYAVKGD